jgi:hypothetical protein
MRWFRRPVQHDSGHQQALLDDLRRRFGTQVPASFAVQAAEIIRLLTDDDGLAVAAAVLREFADTAHADLLAQTAEVNRRTGHGFTVDRRNYRPLWRDAGPDLRWTLFTLPGNLFPYVQVAAAAAVLGAQARRLARMTDPSPVLTHVFEILDLTIDGWEYGRVRVDTDGVALAAQLITTARDLRSAMSQEPPLPPPVRELMRRNNTIQAYAPTENRIVSTFNPGAELRQTLLT